MKKVNSKAKSFSVVSEQTRMVVARISLGSQLGENIPVGLVFACDIVARVAPVAHQVAQPRSLDARPGRGYGPVKQQTGKFPNHLPQRLCCSALADLPRLPFAPPLAARISKGNLRMRKPAPLQAALVAIATAAASTALAASGASAAQAAATPLPAHVFAPYFETYNGDNPVTLSQESGAKDLTFAFIQTASSGSCTAYWDGDTSEPLTSANFGSDISAMQAAGGNVIPSFGGESADNSGTDIADSCTSVNSIAQVYENVISTYNVPRIDLDIEGNSLTNTAGITRRNEAVAQTESWAAANGRSIQFSYTMPGTPTGMDSQEESIISNAISAGATVSVVNLMTFDYFIGTTQEMATDTETAGADLHSQLQSLYPSDSSAQLWSMIGVTEMPGIDDFGAGETFTEADATTVLNWAKGNGVSTLSFWALQRDNGGCPGTGGSDSCSGISQSTWFFSDAFESFAGGPAAAAARPGRSPGTRDCAWMTAARAPRTSTRSRSSPATAPAPSSGPWNPATPCKCLASASTSMPPALPTAQPSISTCATAPSRRPGFPSPTAPWSTPTPASASTTPASEAPAPKPRSGAVPAAPTRSGPCHDRRQRHELARPIARSQAAASASASRTTSFARSDLRPLGA